MTGLTRAFALLSTGALLAGCVVKAGPDYTPPTLAAPETFGPAREALGQTVAREDGWWRGFEDPVLDSLIADALADNLDVAAAAARLAQAREQARVADSARFPTLDAQVGGGLDSVLAGRGGAGRTTTASAEGSAIFNWTPDLFGARTRALEAAQAEARRRAALVADIQRLTVADVARQYVDARRAGARLALLETSLGLQNQTLDIVRSRQEAGLAADLDVNRATAEVAETRAIQGPLELSLESARNSVAVLLGDAPGLTAPALPGEMRVPVYAGGPEPGAPREILRRRPDLAAAEANLARATAEIGVAAGALYPSLSLPGRLTAQATDIGSGMVVEQVIGLLSATLDIPLFDAGGRRAQVRAAEALAQEALLVYRQTLLLALRDAETALVAIRSARLSQKDYREAARASDTAFQQANALYKEGLASFIDILDAQRTLISNREALVEADADLARAIIDFHSAIGTPVPTPAP